MADPVHLADIVQMRPDDDTARAHEEGNLHDRMRHKMQVSALERQRREQCAAEHDIAELPDSREREAPLQVVLTKRDKRACENRERRRPSKAIRDPELGEELRPEHEAEYAKKPSMRSTANAPVLTTATA